MRLYISIASFGSYIIWTPTYVRYKTLLKSNHGNYGIVKINSRFKLYSGTRGNLRYCLYTRCKRLYVLLFSISQLNEQRHCIKQSTTILCERFHRPQPEYVLLGYGVFRSTRTISPFWYGTGHLDNVSYFSASLETSFYLSALQVWGKLWTPAMLNTTPLHVPLTCSTSDCAIVFLVVQHQCLLSAKLVKICTLLYKR